MHSDKVKRTTSKPDSRYLPSVLRLFLICIVLGFLLLGLKACAYDNYLGGPEFELDLKIWGGISVVLSVLPPALEKLKKRYWDKRQT
jgi:hypothetical protein